MPKLAIPLLTRGLYLIHREAWFLGRPRIPKNPIFLKTPSIFFKKILQILIKKNCKALTVAWGGGVKAEI